MFRSRNVIFNEAGLSKEEFDKIALHQFALKPITPDITAENASLDANTQAILDITEAENTQVLDIDEDNESDNVMPNILGSDSDEEDDSQQPSPYDGTTAAATKRYPHRQRRIPGQWYKSSSTNSACAFNATLDETVDAVGDVQSKMNLTPEPKCWNH